MFTNGPVFLFAKSALDRPGHWEDAAVWPFFAVAAAAAAALALEQARIGSELLAVKRCVSRWSSLRSRAAPATASRSTSLLRPRFAAYPLGLLGDRLVRARRPARNAETVAAVAVIWYSLLSVASTAWSVDPKDTAWRSTVYLGLAALAWVISSLDSDDLRAALAMMCGAAMTTSVILVALRSDLGMDANGAWQGVYTNRNSLAPIAALGTLVGIRYVCASGRSWRLAGGGLALLSLASMLGAGSRTAWFALLAGALAATAPVAHHRLRQRRGARQARLVAAVIAFGGTVGAAAALAALWSVSTFAQRRTMWGLVWDRIWQRPIAGHGFFTFWDIEELTLHVLLRRGSAHNSLMEVGLGLGLLGLVPFLVIVVLAARNAMSQVWRSPSPDTWLWAAVVAFLLVENIAESFVLWFSYNWVLVMAAALRPIPSHRSLTRADDAVA